MFRCSFSSYLRFKWLKNLIRQKASFDLDKPPPSPPGLAGKVLGKRIRARQMSPQEAKALASGDCFDQIRVTLPAKTGGEYLCCFMVERAINKESLTQIQGRDLVEEVKDDMKTRRQRVHEDETPDAK